MAFVNPTVDEFKTFFARDFPYGSTPEFVMDQDITKAFIQTNVSIYAGFPTQEVYSLAYEYLAAHFLTLNLQASSQGVAGTGSPGLTTSKSVGSVSEGFQIPDIYMKNPTFAAFSKTKYGQMYFELIYPYLVGAMTVVRGSTRP